MTESRLQTQAQGQLLWRVIAGGVCPDHCDRDLVRILARRFAALTSPALGAWALKPFRDGDPDLLSGDDIERSRQLNRFTQGAGAGWLSRINDAGIEVVCLKGMATAHRFYPDPLIRGMGDVDLLVREKDLGALVRLLCDAGFQFRKSRGTPRWGLSAESSFHPLVAPDGVFCFDLHIHGDDYPVFRSLATEDVFAKSLTETVGDLRLRLPCDDHLILLALTNAARDKFGPPAMRSVVDAMVGLGRPDFACDWDALFTLAAGGGYEKALMTGVSLLAALGVGPEKLPSRKIDATPWPLGAVFANLVGDYRDMFAVEPSLLSLQWRDAALISSLHVIIRRNLRRLKGLIRPWPGVPRGV